MSSSSGGGLIPYQFKADFTEWCQEPSGVTPWLYEEYVKG
jgi:hypothetical protein